MSDPVIDAVLAADRALHGVLEARDLASIRSVWDRSDRALCAHPGRPILRTWRLVEESWRRILEGTGRNRFAVAAESVSFAGAAAWDTVDEDIGVGMVAGPVVATNLFAAHGDRWGLVVHQGSPVLGR